MKLNDAQNPFKADLLSDLQPAGRLSVEQALDHYHQGYIRRLTEVLSDTFETVRWVLGTELFNKICTQYIESHPSNSYNLKDYGLSFPQYLSTLAESKERPFWKILPTWNGFFKKSKILRHQIHCPQRALKSF